MKKKSIFIILLIFILLIIGAGVYAYQTIRAPLEDQFIQAENYALNEEEVRTITEIGYYHGTNAYYVVQGQDQNGIDVILWISDDFNSHHLEKAEDGITAEEAISMVEREENIAQIQSARLGFERGLPIYEVTYETDEEREAYYYVTFSDGTFMKKYQLRTN